MARLVCPLCGTVVVDGGEPASGTCAGCGAAHAGGGASPPEAVEAALAEWGVAGLDAGAVAQRLFEVDPPPAPEPAAAITSDQRDDFYRWWVFVRPGARAAGEVLRGLLGP